MRHPAKFVLLLGAAVVLGGEPAFAQEGRGQPFITVAYYKKNISLDEFRVNPRSYFVSERAFRLIVRYVGDEIGKPNLTASEFVALMRDGSQVRTRACGVGETINTGAMDGDQFYWFIRPCRKGEEIVQALVNGVWKDLFSLNCLNAVEDQSPTPAPVLAQVPATPTPVSRSETIITVIPGKIIGGGTSFIASCWGTSFIQQGTIQTPARIEQITRFGQQ